MGVFMGVALEPPTIQNSWIRACHLCCSPYLKTTIRYGYITQNEDNVKVATTVLFKSNGAQGDMPSQEPRQHDVDLSYGATTLSGNPDELYATIDGEELQQDLQLTENQAYAATTNIPVVSNKCTTLSAQDTDSSMLRLMMVI
jgi:hypothetical protein